MILAFTASMPPTLRAVGIQFKEALSFSFGYQIAFGPETWGPSVSVPSKQQFHLSIDGQTVKIELQFRQPLPAYAGFPRFFVFDDYALSTQTES